jgi:hypothetical protein
MISVTSVTDKYALQPSLLSKHRKSLEWLSSVILWKRELVFFQKLLDVYASRFTSVEAKQRISHFQNFITYYGHELIPAFASRIRVHEAELSEMLQSRDETQTAYFKNHDNLMNELEALDEQFRENKAQFFAFIEQVV